MPKGHELTNAEKTELLKEAMGWYFDGVKPLVWNPCENIKHLERLMMTVYWEPFSSDMVKIFSDMVKSTDAMMPFTKDGREKLVDLCGVCLGLWEVSEIKE